MKFRNKKIKDVSTFLEEFDEIEHKRNKALFIKKKRAIDFNKKFPKLKRHYLMKGYSDEEANKQAKRDIRNNIKTEDLIDKKSKKDWNKSNHSIKDLRSGKISFQKAS